MSSTARAAISRRDFVRQAGCWAGTMSLAASAVVAFPQRLFIDAFDTPQPAWSYGRGCDVNADNCLGNWIRASPFDWVAR